MDKKHKLAKQAAQRGITLLEIMIVLAIIGLVFGILVGPRVFKWFAEAKESVAHTEAKDLANNAYGKWALDNDAQCPDKIEDLAKYANKKDTKDPWGTLYVMKCGGEGMPNDIPFGIVSAGPDKKEGTPDDIHSWDASAKKKN